jgi:hypothetical protein
VTRSRTASHVVHHAFAAAAVCFAAIAVCGCGSRTRQHSSPALRPAARILPTISPSVIAVSLQDPRSKVPGRFLGLSFEASSLPAIAAMGQSGNLVSLLRSLGPGVLRFGGASADSQVAWQIPGMRPPRWATVALTPAIFAQLGVLARRCGWKVILTLGMAHFNPGRAAREAQAAHQALGSSLEAVELGNEPDSYERHGFRKPGWGPAEYAAQAASYMRAIERRVPHLAIAGPAVSGSRAFVDWAPAEIAAVHPGILTGHHYPLGCRQIPAPSIAELLSPIIRREEEESLGRYLDIARADAVPFRVDETGSVSCGGRASVSNTFAAALWALDFTVRAMSAGAAGINFHGNLGNCDGYSPLCASSPATLAAGLLDPQPEWYAMLAAHVLVGERALRVTVLPYLPQINATAFISRRSRGLHVVIINEALTGTPTVVRLEVPGQYSQASVLALTAPSLQSTAGWQLGGRAVSRNGSWWSWQTPVTLGDGGRLDISMAAGSAALVTVR